MIILTFIFDFVIFLGVLTINLHLCIYSLFKSFLPNSPLYDIHWSTFNLFYISPYIWDVLAPPF